MVFYSVYILVVLTSYFTYGYLFDFFDLFFVFIAEFGFTTGNGKTKTRKYGSPRQIVEIYRCLKNFVDLSGV